MEKTLTAREKINDHIEDSSRCGWHATCSHTSFERYCIAKDAIQDTAEALWVHREQDFVDDVSRRYVEYYGVLQAVYIQQDAIEAIFSLFMSPEKIDFSSLSNWRKLRDLRNDTAGHPVGRLKRLNRSEIAYDCVNYQWCLDEKRSSWKSKDVNLAALLDGYDSEAAGVLDSVLRQLEAECSMKHT